MSTLLEKAKALSPKRKQKDSDPEIVQLALGWANGEILLSQVQAVLGKETTSSVYPIVARALRSYIQSLQKQTP